MHSGKISHPDYDLEYFLFGNGPETLIAFHGFNNNAHDFESLGRIAGKKYTIISINIFFHGGSSVKDNVIERGFLDQDLKKLFIEIFNVRSTEKYSLIGYSMGGRLVLKVLELFPEKTDKIILLAADGLYINPFYLFVTRTAIGRSILKKAVYRPGLFEKVAGFLKLTGMVSEKRYHFAKNNFDSARKREKIYQVWLTLRNVVTSRSVIKKLIKEHSIPMFLFFGKFDRIIPTSLGTRFRAGVENLVSIYELEEGHRLMKPEVFEKVMEIIDNQPT